MFKSILTIIVFLPIFIALKGNSTEHWSYENAHNWSDHYHYCDGNLQSPINIEFNTSKHDRGLKRIYFKKENPTPTEPILVNTGHTAKLILSSNYIVKNIASFSEDYKVEQLHFHWSQSDDSKGSEHQIDGKAYPLEMHVVSYSNSFSNMKDAMTNVRGLAVIGVFFELSNKTNENLEPLINVTQYIQQKDHSYLVSDEFRLIPLIGEAGISRYYRYDGSLTTPHCYETVIWTVVAEPLKISQEQLNAFRSLHENQNKPMKNTYRPIQPLGARKVFRSFHSKNIKDEPKEPQYTSGNNGQYLSIHRQIFFIIINFIIITI